LEEEINFNTGCNIKFNQQKKIKEHMSFTGGNGRIGISPSLDKYDITLSGQSLEKQMYSFMSNLCGKENDGHKQTKPEPHAPYWRISDFELVKNAVSYYSKTRK